MPVSHRIDITVSGGDRRQAFNAGNVVRNKQSLNEKNLGNNGDAVTKKNLSKVINVGLAFNLAQRGTEAMGAYTNNRLRQRRQEAAMTFAKYGIGLMINPVGGAIYAGTDLAYRGMMYNIKIQKQNREAEYFRNLSGNNSHSGRRYKGDYL